MCNVTNLSPPNTERPRVRKFRLGLAKAIPRFPSDKTSLQYVLEQQLGQVLVHYLNWRSRYVGIRPRAVSVEAGAQADPRWTAFSVAIKDFLDKVSQGSDLTPYLSTAPHKRGYAAAPRQGLAATNRDPWSDKDMILNTLGYHHFNLDPATNASHAAGPNELLFARVTRDAFSVIAIFGHEVFDLGSGDRHRLDTIHTEIALRHAPPGSSVLKGNVVTSGHNLGVVEYADRCAYCVSTMDRQMDDPAHLKNWFAFAGLAAPKVPTFEWLFDHLDLGFWEKTKKAAFWVQKGWN